MTRDQVMDAIRETLVQTFELDPAQIRPEAHLIDDLHLDSIDAIDMAVKIQELTQKRVEEHELRGLRTVGDVVGLVLKLMPTHEAA